MLTRKPIIATAALSLVLALASCGSSASITSVRDHLRDYGQVSQIEQFDAGTVDFTYARSDGSSVRIYRTDEPGTLAQAIRQANGLLYQTGQGSNPPVERHGNFIIEGTVTPEVLNAIK